MSTLLVSRIRRRQRTRGAVVVAAAAGIALVLLLLALGLGAAGVPPQRALPAVFGIGDRLDLLVVQQLRLPRALAAVLAGAAFGLAGALFQSTLRNNLASPDILGISGGASLGAVTAVVGYGASGGAVTLSALGGGLAAAVAIWALAWRGGLHGLRFVLVGVGVSYVCASLISWRLSEADHRDAGTVLLWTVGSVADVRDELLGLLAVGVAVLAAMAALVGREQRPLALGDDHATALGVRTARARGAALLIGVGLVAQVGGQCHVLQHLLHHPLGARVRGAGGEPVVLADLEV
ncbi:iron chelate uptake ABC transporter family permease subunit, partial [Nocardioides sp. YIM 152588]|uniref:iron chelate uptake ABC transporter family permease subunit n=1 Tax=Nocardioides sp. YIM 152588 TaxID=3158259 RepID=UPI0032E4A270